MGKSLKRVKYKNELLVFELGNSKLILIYRKMFFNGLIIIRNG